MSQKMTQEEYEQKIKDIYQDEYKVLGTYGKPHDKISFQHKCGWIFETGGYYALCGKLNCPVCSMNSKLIDTAVYQQKVINKSGEDYVVTGEYVDMHTPIAMRHKKCSCPQGFFDFHIQPADFLYGSGICPYERHRITSITIDDIQRKLDEFQPGYKCISESYNGPDQKLDILCTQQHVYSTSVDSIYLGNGCPYCSNKAVLKGYNDYWTTHPDRAQYLLNPDDGYSFTYGTTQSQYFRCLICGKIHYKKPIDAFSNSGRFICECNDGISYPEKFMIALLKQLGEPYIYQYNSRYAKWCDKYRYDFYLPRFKAIIEINGMQHYKRNGAFGNYDQLVLNDKQKESLAKNNNINNYIVIDCRYSEFNFVKQSILNSQLSDLLNLQSVDWKQCNIEANSSIMCDVAKLWNEGYESANAIAIALNISQTTAMRYLESAGQCGLCDFNRDKHRKEVNHGAKRIPIKCVETNTKFKSINDAIRTFGFRINNKQIKNNKEVHGFHFEYA